MLVLMGRDGNEEISCAELGEKAGTISWEIITRIGARVRRIYRLGLVVSFASTWKEKMIEVTKVP